MFKTPFCVGNIIINFFHESALLKRLLYYLAGS